MTSYTHENVKFHPWQIAELLHEVPKRVVRADPRLGKTLVGIEWLKKLTGNIHLVVAPLVVCPQWAQLLAAEGFNVVSLYSKTPAAVTGLLAALKHQRTALVINYDKLPRIVEKLLKLGIGGLILDESHYIKSPSSSRGRAARRLARSVPNVRLLTGTVAPNGPQDLWGQFYCVSSDLWGSSYTAFKKKHLIVDNFMYERIVGVKDPKELQRLVDACSGSYRREDVFGADQWQTVVRSFTLEPKARKIYDTIVKDWVLETEKDGFQLSMTHTLSRMKRLQQLTSGYLPDEEGNGKLVHVNKIDLVTGDLEDIIAAGEKAVIFHQFTWEGQEYERRCREAGYTVFTINGGTPANERARNIKLFNELAAGSVFIAQTSAGGIGISLASARHALFVSQSYSFSVEQQARDRIYAPGRSKCVSFYRASRSIDNYIATILDSKSDFNSALARSNISDIAFGELELPNYKGF